ncbi:uncharacterized protein IUM83_19891 [Phytophthora cinnamomi]|uniref:uncharacterized protein n=1 Tax=Phytophthora cinnamomi TaxID=4785 RepID=UPI00355976CD|nr:hypothetical protein IUM83_19891 [Phytophthora cinnamomi]
MVVSLSHEESVARKRIKLAIKFGDLALETFLLVQMLESGSPTPLVAFFSFVVVFNAIACAGMMFVPYERAPRGELFIDVSIDFLVAIGCPMLVVVYCLSAFTFDRTKFAINMEVYPSGWFEQNASVNADPVQVAVIYKSLKSLRIMTALECLARVGVNVMFSFRLRYVVEIIRSPKRLRSSVYPKRHRLGAIGLVLYAIILVIFVEESMRTSTIACHPHPECAVNAHRWTILKSNSLTQCPCLMLIDRDIAPKTFAEWIMPMNVTEKVAQLATTGDLEMLQLTNRYLGELPVELRHCKNLRHLSLEYTNTQTFPPWVEEFTKLEFLHVESKVSSPMVLLPDDMFDDMPSLTFIHLAILYYEEDEKAPADDEEAPPGDKEASAGYESAGNEETPVNDEETAGDEQAIKDKDGDEDIGGGRDLSSGKNGELCLEAKV